MIPPVLERSLRLLRIVAIVVLAVGVLLVACWQADRALKSAPHSGYVPSDSYAVVHIENAPAVVRQILAESGDGTVWYAAFETLWNDVTDAFSQAFILNASPWLWDICVGKSVLVSVAPEGMGCCFRPGLFLRIYDVFLARREMESGVKLRELGSWVYSWHDGFVIIAREKEYVEAALKSEPVRQIGEDYGDKLAVHVRWKGPFPGNATTWIQRDLPVTGHVVANVKHRKSSMTLPSGWGGMPMASFTTSQIDDIIRIISKIVPNAGDSLWTAPNMRGNLTAILEGLPEDWDSRVDECSLALMDVQVRDGIPIPQVALVFRKTDESTEPPPFATTRLFKEAMPFEWNGNPGWMRPFVGPDVTLCLSSYRNDWYMSTCESVMNSISGRLGYARSLSYDAVLQVDWAKLSTRAEELLLKASEWEWIPGRNADDIRLRYLPVMRLLGKTGVLELNGIAKSNGMDFRGYLARGSVLARPKRSLSEEVEGETEPTPTPREAIVVPLGK